MSYSQETSASISLRRPAFHGISRVLTERGKPVADLNPHRIRVLRKQARKYFADAHEFAAKARPFLERRPTDPYSYDFEKAEHFVLEMQHARENALRILRTIRAAKVVDGRGQNWGSAGREFRTDSADTVDAGEGKR